MRERGLEPYPEQLVLVRSTWATRDAEVDAAIHLLAGVKDF